MAAFRIAAGAMLKKDLSSNQKKLLLLCLFCVLAIVMAIFSGPHGHFIVDEGTYHLMARSFADSGSLAVWNGYVEFPSIELMPVQTSVHEGRLVPQYPYLSAVLNLPLYRIAGFQGLIVLNAIAYAAMVGLCFRLARMLFGDPALALNACLILVLATFSWEYSQAAWPQAVSMLFVTAAACFAVAAFKRAPGPGSASLALAAGLVAGFGAGVRLDAVFVLPALIFPFLFLRPWRPGCALAACLGTAPGMLALAATNQAKFGTLSPFAYAPTLAGPATQFGSYLPIAVLGLAVLAAVWFASRPKGRAAMRANRWAVAAGLAILGTVLLLTPATRDLGFRMANGLYQLLIDLRIRDLDLGHGGLTRGPGGSLVYLGGVKKALLQSCPYLVVLVVPIALFLRGAKDSLSLGFLLLTPGAFVAAYAYFAWDGGQGFNLRYFTPILPFTSILAAYAWGRVTRELRDSQRRLVMFAGAATGAVYVMGIVIGPAILWGPMTIERQETVFLTLPLVIAAIALILLLVQTIEPKAAVRCATAATLVVALVWSGMVAFAYDFPRSDAWRKERAELSETLARFIQKDAVVISANPHLFYGLPDDLRARIALPLRDDFADFRRLIEFHLDRDQAVYIWLTETLEEETRKRALLEAYAVVSLHEHRWGSFARLTRRSEP